MWITVINFNLKVPPEYYFYILEIALKIIYFGRTIVAHFLFLKIVIKIGMFYSI